MFSFLIDRIKIYEKYNIVKNKDQLIKLCMVRYQLLIMFIYRFFYTSYCHVILFFVNNECF